MNNDTEFSVQETLAGKKILLIGATGFLGRIMLYLLLKKVSGIAHLFLLIRATPGRDAQFRFAKEILESPVFTTVAGDDVFFTEDYLSQKVTVVEGDAAEENFSISDMSLYDRLLQETDIVINTAGNVDFNPPLDISLKANTESIQEILGFCAKSRSKKLVHVSTCFVVDRQMIPQGESSMEEPVANWYYTKLGEKVVVDPISEIERAKAAIVQIKSVSEKGVRDRASIKEQRRGLVDLGKKIAAQVNRPNCYTYTKFLAELLIQEQMEKQAVQAAIIRPAIVETSVQIPFTGWNEGIQGSAPLMYMVEKGHRFIPTLDYRNGDTNVRLDAANLDCIPVDLVANGAVLACCALFQNRNEKVYQLSAGDVDPPITVDTFVQVMTQAKREQANQKNRLERFVANKLHPLSVVQEKFQKYSNPRTFTVLRHCMDMFSDLNLNVENQQMRFFLDQGKSEIERFFQISLAKKKIFEEFMPFIFEGYPMFDNRKIKELSRQLAPSERKTFGFDPSQIDYLDYLSRIHLHSVRQWIFPILEKRFRVLERSHWQQVRKRNIGANEKNQSDGLHKPSLHQAGREARVGNSTTAPFENPKLLRLLEPLDPLRGNFLKYLGISRFSEMNWHEMESLHDHMRLILGTERKNCIDSNNNRTDRTDSGVRRTSGKKKFKFSSSFAGKSNWFRTFSTRLPKAGVVIKNPWKQPIDEALYQFQMWFYRNQMQCQIQGRENIPLNNQNMIVIANHSSHLDYGLIWYGLGKYARRMGILAAEDYFFNNFFKSTFLRNFLNLIPVSRNPHQGYRDAFQAAVNFLQQGGPLLIFPEGTRSTTGEMQNFKQGLGYLVYHAGAHVLPVKLSGTFSAMPKGKVIPKKSQSVSMRIGRPLSSETLCEDTQNFTATRKYYCITQRLQKILEAL